MHLHLDARCLVGIGIQFQEPLQHSNARCRIVCSLAKGDAGCGEKLLKIRGKKWSANAPRLTVARFPKPLLVHRPVVGSRPPHTATRRIRSNDPRRSRHLSRTLAREGCQQHGFACSRAEHRAEHRDASAEAVPRVCRVHSEERISIRGLLDSRSPRPALPLGSCGSSFGPHRAFELDGNVWSRTSRNRLVSVTPNLATGTRS